MSKAIVWTKGTEPQCQEAIKLLKDMGMEVEERNVSTDVKWNVAKFKAAVPGAKTIPQIIIDDQLIGGLPQLKALPEAAPKMSAGNPAAEKKAKVEAYKSQMAARATNKAARDAARAEQATKGPWRMNPQGTRAERHVAKAERIQARLAARNAAQPRRAMALDDNNPSQQYQTGAPMHATEDQVLRRHAEQKAAAISKTATYRSDNAAAIQARRADRLARKAADKIA